MARATSVKSSWPLKHYLDTEGAIAFLSEKVEELAAVTELATHAVKFAGNEAELNAWIEKLDRDCEEMSKTAATVAELVKKDEVVLMVLNPRGRQMLKSQLASAAAQLQKAKALRDRPPEKG